MNIAVKHTASKPIIILNLILDESGSMSGQRMEVISGCNEYIQTMKSKAKDANYVVNLIKFGNKTEVVFKNKPIEEVRELTKKDYDPQYSTALRDAIGNTINLTEAQMEYVHTGATALFYIFTDGYENASTEFSPEQIKTMISTREAKGGWTFSFIGASKECLNQAQQWGISVGNTITYNAGNFRAAINNLTASTCCYAKNVGQGITRTSSLFADAGYDTSKNIDEQEVDSSAKPIWQVTQTTTVPQK